MNLIDFTNAAKELETKVVIAKQNEANIKSDIVQLKNKISGYEKTNENLEKINAILTQTATTSRNNARLHFEKIVTDALQFVTQSKDYEFVIVELENRAKASYEFYIKSTVNGVECLQKPEDANGGGFVDIISVAAKYAYLEIFNDPKIMSGTLLFDEPGKMISEQMSIKFAEYIKFLGTYYNRQTIMITHNENLSNVADKTFVVKKNNAGISQVNDDTTMPKFAIDSSFWDILEKRIEEDKKFGG